MLAAIALGEEAAAETEDDGDRGSADEEGNATGEAAGEVGIEEDANAEVEEDGEENAHCRSGHAEPRGAAKCFWT